MSELLKGWKETKMEHRLREALSGLLKAQLHFDMTKALYDSLARPNPKDRQELSAAACKLNDATDKARAALAEKAR